MMRHKLVLALITAALVVAATSAAFTLFSSPTPFSPSGLWEQPRTDAVARFDLRDSKRLPAPLGLA